MIIDKRMEIRDRPFGLIGTCLQVRALEYPEQESFHCKTT
jgi:hypothetical protein